MTYAKQFTMVDTKTLIAIRSAIQYNSRGTGRGYVNQEDWQLVNHLIKRAERQALEETFAAPTKETVVSKITVKEAESIADDIAPAFVDVGAPITQLRYAAILRAFDRVGLILK